MQVGRQEPGGEAVMVLKVDQNVPQQVIVELKKWNTFTMLWLSTYNEKGHELIFLQARDEWICKIRRENMDRQQTIQIVDFSSWS